MHRLVVLIAAGILAASCATPSEPDTATPARPRTETPSGDDAAGEPQRARGPRGESAPDFTVTTFTGDRFALGEQRGTPVVLNFWESW